MRLRSPIPNLCCCQCKVRWIRRSVRLTQLSALKQLGCLSEACYQHQDLPNGLQPFYLGSPCEIFSSMQRPPEWQGGQSCRHWAPSKTGDGLSTAGKCWLFHCSGPHTGQATTLGDEGAAPVIGTAKQHLSLLYFRVCLPVFVVPMPGVALPCAECNHPLRAAKTELTGSILSQNNAAISAGEWWRFVTPAFLHSGVIHVAINCYSLKNLGPFMETLSNRKRFAAVYAAGALGCTVLSYLCSPVHSVGASGTDGTLKQAQKSGM